MLFRSGALSIIGLPPTGGSWSKWLLALGAAERSPVLLGVLMLSSLLSIGYLLPIPLRAFFCDGAADEPTAEQGDEHSHDHGEARGLMLVPICITAAGCLLLFFYSQHIVALLRPVVTP